LVQTITWRSLDNQPARALARRPDGRPGPVRPGWRNVRAS
jgi:hypothetical protein